MENIEEKSLAYHEQGRCGKIEVVSSKPCQTADDLSLAYTPGVAAPVLAIADDPALAYRYTSKGNLVGVISNGTAILGLGDRGALASKPVMEGKGILFKRFADIDVFDIELDQKDPQKIIDIVKALAPTFGGINLEDIKAPECFEIEQRLIKECDIPVFHDDQHGTAIICTAAFINASEIVGKPINQMKIVFNGAGAAGISCAKMFISAGAKLENILMCDRQGVIYKGRDNLTEEKRLFAADTQCRTLADALEGADVFAGLSVADCLTPKMLQSMAKDPIVFAMANPNPEIKPELALKTRNDIIMATGRSDYPNQINNVLGFPFIFRGALDVKARIISEGMKLAAAMALARLAKEPIDPIVKRAYNNIDFVFGKDYIIPKPFDPRVIEWESVAVAKAACDEGLAREPITDWEAYKNALRKRMEKYWK